VLDNTINPELLPPWITEADLDYMSADFARTGFRGGLNYYRNTDRNLGVASALGRRRHPPERSLHRRSRGPFNRFRHQQAPLEAMKTTVPNLQRQVLIEGAGHWIQQERPQQVNTALIQFLQRVAVP
jgi:pimeloyl-ACP methyl ester carboxylesterase